MGNMILEKEVWVTIVGINAKYYEKLGYNIPKRIDKYGKLTIPRRTKILIKTNDLPERSHIKVTKICDECGKKIPNQPYDAINLCRKQGDGKDRCKDCSPKYAGKVRKDNIQYENTFEYWVKQNNKEYLLEEFSIKNYRKPNHISKFSNEIFLWNCLKCNSEFSMAINKRTERNQNCPYCAGQKINETNCLSTIRPDIASLLVDSSIGHKVTIGSGKKTYFKCSKCGHIDKKTIRNVVYQGFSCLCSDGISYPEKFMMSVLDQLNVQYETQKTFDWSKKIYHLKPEFNQLSGMKKYDFYIPSMNMIIETHGEQHYKTSFKGVGGRDINQEVENDDLKMYLSYNNGIKKYCIINCRKSELDWIKNSILKSKLTTIFDFSKINWLKCHEFACNTLVKKVCDLWNSGITSTNEIGKIVKLSRVTVGKYLKQGSKIGWTDYDPDYSRTLNGIKNGTNVTRKIVQLTKNGEYIKIWNSGVEIQKELGITKGNLPAACKGKKNLLGCRWMYLDDYEKQLSETV
jgi:hypothetical protein